ncbi:hypothetical protein FS749_011385 [Ceratobasidium sp. UAMH 11750]|nr:hypothetical protein FS749_011385 [Ceratobasidium sp. UAMH 11750]
MGRFTPTGVHRQRIMDIHPKKGIKLPPTDHFHSFFSKFGSILEVYHNGATKKGVEHVYVVFKTNDAVPKFKQHWNSKTTTGYWKDSCNIITGISNAPRELMDRISPLGESSSSKDNAPLPQEDAESSKAADPEDGEIIESSISGEQSSNGTKPSKRKREELATEQSQKKKRPAEEPESNESGSSTDSLPANTLEDSPTPADESSIKHMKKEPRHTPRLSPTPPALGFARQAAILAAKARKRSEQTKAANEVISELERLKTERNEARAERDALKAELDEAIVQRDAAVEASRQSQRELEELKSSIEDRDEKTDEVLSLVTASLQSLQRKPRREE